MNSFTTNLQINIDEFTFIIFHKEKILLRTWEECAKTIIYEFVKNSNIDVVFDGKVNEKIGGNLQGYTRTYDLGLKDYYFAIAYNEHIPDMGVCIKFSAKA